MDTVEQVWAVGEDGSSPVLTSSVTSEICPSDATGWAYTDGSQDCSLEIKCGAETLYSVTSTDSSGDSSTISTASPMPATISATPAGLKIA